VADADQARVNGMSKEYNFVFSAFVVLFFGCVFIFLSSRVFLILLFVSVFVSLS
jgi:hypothetical protein